MNEKYKRRAMEEFALVKEALLSIRREKYGEVESGSLERYVVTITQDS